MANSRSILANPQLRSGCSRTMHIPDIVSQTPLCETAHAQPSISSGTMHIPDIVSQTPLCETAHAQVPIVSEHPAKDSPQLAAEQCASLTWPLRHFFVGKQMLRLNHVPNSCLIVQKRKRPNTDLLFLSGDKPLPSSSANVLRAAGIAELLSQYPNQRFVDTLTSIVTHGIRVGYEGSLSGRTRRPNHSSSYLHVDVIKNSIQSELKKGRIKQVQLPTDYFCSPIGLVPQSFSESSHNSAPQNKTATSKRHFAWHLPPFYDAENLHGILGQAPNTFPPLQDIMSNSTLTTP